MQLDSLDPTSAKKMIQLGAGQEMTSDQTCEKIVEVNAGPHATTQEETWLSQGYCLRDDGLLDLSISSKAIRAM